MTQPHFYRQPLGNAWGSMDKGFWLVHTAKYPDGLVFEEGRGERIYLQHKNGNRFGFTYFGNDDAVTGPFDRARDAVNFRTLVPVPYIGEIGDVCEGRR